MSPCASRSLLALLESPVLPVLPPSCVVWLPAIDLKDDIDIGVVSLDNEKLPLTFLDATNISAEMHARILRKIDWNILPFITLLYLLSFLDRTNIGNAKIAGMEEDLNLIGLRYNTAAAIFFVPYCLGQPPSNIILKLLRPSRWIPSIMVVWGLIMTLMSLVKTYHQLLVARFFLGLAESGLLPGMAYYISLWYPRAERGRRYAIFASAVTLAGAFSGILAYVIEKMDGLGGLRGWQWIFCLEGIVTVLVALSAPFFMYDSAEKASFLTEDERQCVIEVMKADSQGLATHYDSRFVLQALRDYKIYFLVVIYFGFVVPSYALALFTPTIIHELGFSATHAQLLSVPPSVASCVCSILVGIFSDKCRLRGPWAVAGAVIGLVGFSILYAQLPPGVALLGIVIVGIGISTPLPVGLAWISSNAGGEAKRAVAIAMVTGFANIGGICASFMFFDPPRFHVGLGISMGLLSCSMLTSLIAMWNFVRMNKQKERWCNEHGITDERKEEFSEAGDDSPLFRYTI